MPSKATLLRKNANVHIKCVFLHNLHEQINCIFTFQPTEQHVSKIILDLSLSPKVLFYHTGCITKFACNYGERVTAFLRTHLSPFLTTRFCCAG